ncbi:hypothetical protein BJX99DRAFT_225308 [Aspergillus californicus]
MKQSLIDFPVGHFCSGKPPFELGTSETGSISTCPWVILQNGCFETYPCHPSRLSAPSFEGNLPTFSAIAIIMIIIPCLTAWLQHVFCPFPFDMRA